MTLLKKLWLNGGLRYGSFDNTAAIAQELKRTLRASYNWHWNLSPSMQESLDMIANKLGRILNGDPTYIDSWHDIAGYATLVEQELIKYSTQQTLATPD